VYRAGTAFLAIFALSACVTPAAGILDPGQVLTRDHVIGGAGPIPSRGDTGVGGTGAAPVLGESCRSDDINQICLGIKYVVYKDTANVPVIDQQAAAANIQTINRLWGQCKIGFQIDQYQAIDPAEIQLKLALSNFGDLDQARRVFADDDMLLIINTGAWDRSGSLGSTGANAWTSMPGGPPYGAVIEKPVAKFANIIAHELGHYLNLYHDNDATDLMNPIIYSNSTQLKPSQCATARSAAAFFWTKMYR
jgi:hypothetical protein